MSSVCWFIHDYDQNIFLGEVLKLEPYRIYVASFGWKGRCEPLLFVEKYYNFLILFMLDILLSTVLRNVQTHILLIS